MRKFDNFFYICSNLYLNRHQQVIQNVETVLERKGFEYFVTGLIKHKILNFLVDDKIIVSYLSKRLEQSDLDTILFLNRITMFRNDVLRKDLKKLTKKHVDFLVYKGFVANFNFYSNPGLRIMNDIDLVISASEKKKINPILLDMGYKYGFVNENGDFSEDNEEKEDDDKSYYKKHVVTFSGDYKEKVFHKANVFKMDNNSFFFYSEIETITKIKEKKQTFNKNDIISIKYYLNDMEYMGISPVDIIYFTSLKFENDYSSGKHSWAYIYEIIETIRNGKIIIEEAERIFLERESIETWHFVCKYLSKFIDKGE